MNLPDFLYDPRAYLGPHICRITHRHRWLPWGFPWRRCSRCLHVEAVPR